MIFLLNLLFAILAFLLTRWLCGELGAPRQLSVVVSVLVALVVFFMNFGAHVL